MLRDEARFQNAERRKQEFEEKVVAKRARKLQKKEAKTVRRGRLAAT